MSCSSASDLANNFCIRTLKTVISTSSALLRFFQTSNNFVMSAIFDWEFRSACCKSACVFSFCELATAEDNNKSRSYIRKYTIITINLPWLTVTSLNWKSQIINSHLPFNLIHLTFSVQLRCINFIFHK